MAFTPTVLVTDTTDHLTIPPAPVRVQLFNNPTPTVRLLATDNAAPAPAGWAWQIAGTYPGTPPAQQYLIAFADGATQYLSDLVPATSAPAVYVAIPVTGTPTAGQVITALSATTADWETPGTGVAGSVAWYNVKASAYGATGNGTTDDTAAIQAAWTAAITAGHGIVYYPPGTYRQNSTVTANVNGGSVVAWMDPGAKVLYYGSGDCLRIYDSSSYNARVTQKCGIDGFGVIDGTNSSASAASSAVHIGDMLQLVMNVSVVNWHNHAGSIGVHFNNNYYWTEQLRGRIYAQSCLTHVQFDNSANTSGSAVGSFERMLLDIFLDQNGVGDGVTFANGAFMSNGSLGIYGNFNGSSTTQYAALRLTGQSPVGESVITNSSIGYGELRIACELDGGTTTFPTQTINFGSSSNGIYKCSGYIDFSQAGAFTPSNNGGEFLFSGPVYGDTTLYPMRGLDATAFSQVITANGQTVSTGYLSRNRLGGTGPFTGLVLAAGGFEGQEVILTNMGSGTLTFAAAGTSNVADGLSDTITANVQRRYTWDTAHALWYSDAGGGTTAADAYLLRVFAV